MENKAIFEEKYSSDYSSPDATEKFEGYFKMAFQAKLNRIKSIAKNRRSLDIGCGSGSYLIPLIKENIDAYGVEFVDSFVKKTQSFLDEHNQFRVKNADACSLPFEDGFFQFIYSTSTFPYIEDQHTALSEAARVSSEHGLIFIEFGNMQSMNKIKTDRIHTGIHSYYKSVSDIISMVEANGFRILAIRPGQLFPMYVDINDPDDECFSCMFTKDFMKKIVRGDVLIDEAVCSFAVNCDYAYRITVIARKERIESPFVYQCQKGVPEKWQSNNLKFDVDAMRASPQRYISQICQCFMVDPSDCFAVYAVMKMHGSFYDGLAEQYLKDVQGVYGEHVVPGFAKKLTVSAPSFKGISVVVPVYNGMPHLPGLMQSLFSQTFRPFEMIVVNDGSTDDSGTYLDRLKAPDGIDLKVIHQENRKLPGALNRGFEVSSGSKLTWVSADCACHPMMFETLSMALDDFPDAGMAYSGFFFMDDESNITGKMENQPLLLRDLMIRNQGNACFMYTREAMKQTGLYNERHVGVEDWEYWLKMSLKFSFVYVQGAFYYYRIHDGSMQSTMGLEINETAEKMIGDFIKSGGDRLDLRILYPSIVKADPGEEREMLITEAQADFSAKLLTARTHFMMQLAPMFMDEIFKKRVHPVMALRTLAHYSITLVAKDRMDDAVACASRALDAVKAYDLKGNETAIRYRDTLHRFILSKDPSILSGLMPVWVSEEKKLFSSDRLHVYGK